MRASPYPSLRQALDRLIASALAAVNPAQAVLQRVRLQDGNLKIDEDSYQLSGDRRVSLLGVGKAAYPMAQALQQLLGKRLSEGLLVVKYDHAGPPLEGIQILEAGHPEPDENGLRAAETVIRFLEARNSEKNLIILLISGGASALLPAPKPGLSLTDKLETTRVLLRCGADIHETNCVRSALSRLKGGRLLRHSKDAEIVALLVSDVPGDRLSSIASGLTVVSDRRDNPWDVVDRYGLHDQLPSRVLSVLEKFSSNHQVDTKQLRTPHHYLIANNIMALEGAAKESRQLGFQPLILSSSLTGDTRQAARFHVDLAGEVIRSGHPILPPCALISGGETTVQVQGSGRGGRNQEFVLEAARRIAGWKSPLLVASIGTDGTDGPTPAAGAFATPETLGEARQKGLSARGSAQANDSYHFFKALGNCIVTGPTQTNVMDLRVILIPLLQGFPDTTATS